MSKPTSIAPVGHFEKVRALAANARFLVVGGVRASEGSVVHIHDHRGAGARVAAIAVPCAVAAVALEGDDVLVGGGDGALRRFSLEGAAKGVLPLHPGGITGLAVHKGRVATVGADGGARLVDLASFSVQASYALSPAPLRAVALDSKGEVLAAGGDDAILRAVTLADGAVREMPGHEGPIAGTCFTGDGRVASTGDDGRLLLFFLVGAADADPRSAADGHAEGATAIAMLPTKDADRIVTIGRDGLAKVYRLNERRKPRTVEVGGALFALAFLPAAGRSTAGTLLVAGDNRRILAFTFAADGDLARSATVYESGFHVLESALAGEKGARLAAVAELAGLAEREATELLLRLTDDKEPEVRAEAATTLGRTLRTAASAKLRTLLDDNAPTVRVAALDALSRLEGPAPMGTLRAALGSRHPKLRIEALTRAARLRSESPLALGLVAGALTDSEVSVRLAAVEELVGLFPRASLEPLRMAFERGTADVRVDVLVRAAVAGVANAPEIAPLFTRALDEDDAELRSTALCLLFLGQRKVAARLAEHPFFAPAMERTLLRVAKIAFGLEQGRPEPEAKAKADKDKDEARARIDKEALEKAKGVVPATASPGADITDDDLAPLLAAIACKNASAALGGAVGLAILGDVRALGALLPLSRADHGGTRASAAAGLAMLNDERAEKRLAWMLDDPESNVRDQAYQALARLNEGQDVRLAEAALRASQEDIRVRGLGLLVKAGAKAENASSLLADALEDEAPNVRAEALRALWAWHASNLPAAIERALEARFHDLRLRAVVELEARGKEPWAQALIERTIADRDARVATAAYDALVKIHGKKDPRAHLAGIAASPPSLKAKAAKASVDASEARGELRSPLMRQLTDDDVGARTAALEALDLLFPSEAGPLYAGIQSSFLDLRVRAAELLAARHDEQIIEPMRALLLDKELIRRMDPGLVQGLRRRASMALADLGSPRLVKWLSTVLLLDEDGVVREQAARGMSNGGRLGEEGFLLDALGHSEIAVRSWAGEGLARLGDVRALPVLTGTLRHDHEPIRVGAILSFAALGPEGYGGMLQGLEDTSREVQRIVLTIVLARDLRARRAGQSPDLLTSALSSLRPEVRFAAARALELRSDEPAYLAHLVAVIEPEKPEKASEMVGWPSEAERRRVVLALADALTSDRPEQRYAAAQVLRRRREPKAFYREADKATKLRTASSPIRPETSPRPLDPQPAPEGAEGDGGTDAKPKGPLSWVRSVFSRKAPRGPAASPTEEARRLRGLAFGAYVGLLRQPLAGDEEGHRVRRDAIERIVALTKASDVSLTAATPALARALDDENHLVRRRAFAALRELHGKDDTALTLALASRSEDVARSALDELAARGPAARPRLVQALDAPLRQTRAAAFEILEKSSPEGSLEPVFFALASSWPDTRLEVLERLAGSSDDRVVPALLKALESDYDDLRLRAAEILAQRQDERAVPGLRPFLRAALAEAGARPRERAITALLGLRAPSAMDALGEYIDDVETPSERRSDLLGRLGDTLYRDARRAIFPRLADTSGSVRLAAFAALVRLADGVLPPFRGRPVRDIELLAEGAELAVKSKDAELRTQVATELGRAPLSGRPESRSPADPRLDALLVALFGDRDRAVRTAAVEAYSARVLRGVAEPSALLPVLTRGERETLLFAAEGIAPTHNVAALRPLLLCARAAGDGQRERALVALGVLGDPRGLEELETVANGGTEDAPVEPTMRAAALEGLGRLHGHLVDLEVRNRVKERILGHVGDRDSLMAVAAVRALRGLGDEASRLRIEAILGDSDSPDGEREVAASMLGELANPGSEAALAQVLSEYAYSVHEAARDALERLFPNEPVRVALAAVACENQSISEPAAAYLVAEAPASELLERLPRVKDTTLRSRLSFGLLRRESLPVDRLASLLRSQDAREHVAWLLSLRAEKSPSTVGALVALGRELHASLGASRNRSEPDQRTLTYVVAALGRCAEIGDEAALALARVLFADVRLPEPVRRESARLLGHLDRAAPEIVAGMTEQDLALRGLAASLLSERDGERFATNVLGVFPLDAVIYGQHARVSSPRPLLEQPSGRRLLVPSLLGKGAIDVLIDVAFHGATEPSRLAAIAALGRSTAAESTHTLKKLSHRDGPEPEPIRRAAYRSLRRSLRLAAKAQPRGGAA